MTRDSLPVLRTMDDRPFLCDPLFCDLAKGGEKSLRDSDGQSGREAPPERTKPGRPLNPAPRSA